MVIANYPVVDGPYATTFPCAFQAPPNFSQPARSSDQVSRIGAIHQRFLQGSIIFIAHQLLDKLGENLGFYYDHTTFIVRQWRILSNGFHLGKLGAYLCPGVWLRSPW